MLLQDVPVLYAAALWGILTGYNAVLGGNSNVENGGRDTFLDVAKTEMRRHYAEVYPIPPYHATRP